MWKYRQRYETYVPRCDVSTQGLTPGWRLPTLRVYASKKINTACGTRDAGNWEKTLAMLRGYSSQKHSQPTPFRSESADVEWLRGFLSRLSGRLRQDACHEVLDLGRSSINPSSCQPHGSRQYPEQKPTLPLH